MWVTGSRLLIKIQSSWNYVTDDVPTVAFICHLLTFDLVLSSVNDCFVLKGSTYVLERAARPGLRLRRLWKKVNNLFKLDHISSFHSNYTIGIFVHRKIVTERRFIIKRKEPKYIATCCVCIGLCWHIWRNPMWMLVSRLPYNYLVITSDDGSSPCASIKWLAMFNK